MTFLTGKTILIISSEKWNDLRLSKHHYAEELASRGNHVFFLNPPESSYNLPVVTKVINERLKVIDFNTHVKGERFIPLRILNMVRRKQAKKIDQLCGKKIDIVWSFFPNQFHDLRVFKGSLKIFHPVDKILTPKYVRSAKNADVVFSVAEYLLNDFRPYNQHCYFINHGLSKTYASVPLKESYQVGATIKVGYVGNLLRPDIDHKVFLQIIESNPDLQFIIWGSTDYKQLDWNHSGEKSVIEFIEQLRKYEHVTLRGLVHPDIVVEESAMMDMFFCCYDPLKEINRASNNHKLMEYFSSGKVVVSHFMETYDSKRQLLEMCSGYTNEELPILFDKVVQNITYWNSDVFRMQRIEFARSNTYSLQIDRIQHIISSL